MGTYESKQNLTYPAAADLSASQYCFVSVNSAGRVAVTGDGLRASGVLQNAPAAIDRDAEVGIGGALKIKLGATCVPGQQLAADASGRAIPATTGDVIMGECREGGAINEIGSIVFDTGKVATVVG